MYEPSNRHPAAAAPGTRREFLRRAALAAAAAPLAGALRAQRPLAAGIARPRLPFGTRHVVVVAFAGGVRGKDVIETPANAPHLHRIARNGVLLPNVRCRNVGHYGAALSIFTGNVEVMGIRDDGRGLNPTMFEYLRKDGGLDASDLWISTSNGAQGRLFAHSEHPDYGAAYGANVLDGDGIFNVEFQKVLDAFGRPRRDGERDLAILDKLAGSLDTEALASLASGAADPAHVRRVERFILDELSGSTARVTGPGSGDAKAIRVGLNILRAFRPRVLGITLQNADVAHGSYNGYVEVIRRNDEEIGRLWDAIQQDEDLRETTSVLVLPEFGRDQDLNQRNGLDHGDNSECLRKVFLIAAGPDFKRDRVIRTECDTHDVCPTVLSLFGVAPSRMVGGKRIGELFA